MSVPLETQFYDNSKIEKIPISEHKTFNLPKLEESVNSWESGSLRTYIKPLEKSPQLE